MKKRICVVSGSRAEYGLLSNLMREMKADEDIELQVVVTGMHLSEQFGNTFLEFNNDGLDIAKTIPILEDSDSSVSIANAISKGISGFAQVFDELKPELLLVLGDRFEIFSAATAAHVSRIPISHIHGGETTEGLMDEFFRHSITKMSQIHFVSTEVYRKRVIQLGENPLSVHNVGSLGVENLLNMSFIEKSKLEHELRLEFQENSMLITYHPVTLDTQDSRNEFCELLAALEQYPKATYIFTFPNADLGSEGIIDLVKKFSDARNNAFVFQSLGQAKYFSCMKYVDVVIGNSSSGIIEAPSLKKPTVNVGDRQSGRLRAESVIDCSPTKSSILEALEKAFSSAFQKQIRNVSNPYQRAGTSANILRIMKETNLDNILKKSFYDLDFQ